MKRIIVVCMMIIMCFVFTGCGNDITLTSEQNDLIAEYIAGTMLKYSYENEWKYQKLNTALNTYVSNRPQEVTKPEQQTSSQNQNTSSSTSGGNVSGGNKTQTSTDVLGELANTLGIDTATIVYDSYVVGDSYPAGSYVLTVPAEPGCKVVAIEFTIKNTTNSTITANTAGKGISMKLSVGGSNVSTYPSMLKNDLLKLSNVSIQAGAEYKAFVLFQVNESLVTGVEGSVLSVDASGTSLGTFTIK